VNFHTVAKIPLLSSYKLEDEEGLKGDFSVG